MKKINFIILTTFCLIFNLYAGETQVPLQKGIRLPSDDLNYNGQVLSSQDALELSSKVDLSKLNPNENEIFDGQNNLVNQKKNIRFTSNEAATFQGAILSNTGLLRFNVTSLYDGSLLTVHLDKTLHTLLLRNALLLRLGYKLPELKYLEKIRINFKNKQEKEDFLKRIIPENTLGASDRWLVEENESSVVLQDVAVTSPSESDFYNLSLGVPSEGINSRTIRSLAVFYNLVDLGESVNQFNWVTGKIDNKALVLNHFTGNSFTTSIEDVIWAQNKLNQLSRNDFIKIVAEAKLPPSISDLIIEKLISRKSSLNKLLHIDSEESFNSKISSGNEVADGKVVVDTFPGFASRFSYGNAETPFDQMRYYLYSKLQSNIIDNLINFANDKLQAFDLNESRADYFKDQFQEGLKHFVETGELLPIKIGTWISPVLTGKVIVSRDIVLGNYLGTENLVQLADTFGAGVDLGVAVGVEGLPYGASASVNNTTSLVRTFTHLKPVKSLKNSLKEPFRNLFVPLLKKNLKDDYLSLSEIQKGTDEAVKTKKVQDLLKSLDKLLGVGESLIMTDRIMPTSSVDLNYSEGIVGAGVGVKGSIVFLKRIHFYKKAPQTLQIFDDYGHSKVIDLSFRISSIGIPILRIGANEDKGSYHINSYLVNLNSNKDENPNFYQNALGVYEVLKSKNFELISKQAKPVQVNASYKDKTSSLSFLLWKVKKIKGQNFIDVQAKDGINGKYFHYKKDFMSGVNIESMTKQIANYYIREDVNDKVSITDDSFSKNPGDTLWGRSHLENYRYEAAINPEGKFEKKFLGLTDIRQGWSMTQSGLIKFIDSINQKFNTRLFDKNVIDFKKIRLFKIGYRLNIYENGVERINNLTSADIDKIEIRYKAEANCMEDDIARDQKSCGDLRQLRRQLLKCKVTTLSEANKAQCHTDLFEKLLNDLKFDDFKSIVGDGNFYLFASIDGFRVNSEVLNDTLYSNSIGKIGSQFWNGPMDVVRSLIGISDGEFSGGWLRGDI